MEAAARAQFELENNITLVNPQRDAIYGYDAAHQTELMKAQPWKNNPTYFKKVRISAIALLKMVTHARSGGSIEVMGIMQGKIHHNSFVITDAYPLPVEGTETRVNAHAQAYEYMVQYMQEGQKAGRQENVVGWYHSHPGYGCWLSGIDVNTQLQQQSYTDPFLAVVVDPDRTVSAGKVDIGAFRTYPEGYRANDTHDEEYQTIPLSKIEDFGAHSSQYYPLEIEHFKSTLDSHLLDLLWNKYWVQTLSQAPLFINKEYSSKQILDLSKKINNAETQGAFRSTAIQGGYTPGKSATGGGEEKSSAMDKIVKDSNKIASEEITGLLSSVLKERIFGDIKVVESVPSSSS